MNKIQFTGRLVADVRVMKTVNNGKDAQFLSFTLIEHGKDKNAVIECTKSFFGDEPAIARYLLKGTLLFTPYAKIRKDQQGVDKAVMGVFVNHIEILSSPKRDN